MAAQIPVKCWFCKSVHAAKMSASCAIPCLDLTMIQTLSMVWCTSIIKVYDIRKVLKPSRNRCKTFFSIIH
jgi:hypothetical protein